MGRPPPCRWGEGEDDEKSTIKVKKGPWTAEEDAKLVDYVTNMMKGRRHTNWKSLPKLAGLNRCGKSCRLRWTNYLRPDIKRGQFSDDEERLVVHLHSLLGNKWSKIATHLQGRTDNEIKNYYNTHIRKKLLSMGIDPKTHKPRTDHLEQQQQQQQQILNFSQLIGAAHQLSNFNNNLNTPPFSNSNAATSLLNTLLATSAATAFQNQLLLLARVMNSNPIASDRGLFRNFNDIIGPSSLLVNNRSDDGPESVPKSLAAWEECSMLPGLVQAEEEGMREGCDFSTFSEGTTTTRTRFSSPEGGVESELEAWERLLMMDDDDDFIN